MAIICKGRGDPGHSQQGQLLWDIDLIVDGHGERKSRIRSDESASYVVSDEAIVDILSSV